MAGGSEDTTGAVPQSISPDEIERLTATRREMFKRKEAKRIGKWERMLVVAERDGGGNAVRWKWEEAGKGRKVSPSSRLYVNDKSVLILPVPQITERVYKGIPDRWRSAAWSALIDAKTRHHPAQGITQTDVSALFEKYRVC